MGKNKSSLLQCNPVNYTINKWWLQFEQFAEKPWSHFNCNGNWCLMSVGPMTALSFLRDVIFNFSVMVVHNPIINGGKFLDLIVDIKWLAVMKRDHFCWLICLSYFSDDPSSTTARSLTILSPMPIPMVRSLLCQQVHGSSYGTSDVGLSCGLISFSPVYNVCFTWKMSNETFDNPPSERKHIQTFLPSHLALLCEFSLFPLGVVLTSMQLSLKFSSVVYAQVYAEILDHTLIWFPGFVYIISSLLTAVAIVPIRYKNTSKQIIFQRCIWNQSSWQPHTLINNNNRLPGRTRMLYRREKNTIKNRQKKWTIKRTIKSQGEGGLKPMGFETGFVLR